MSSRPFVGLRIEDFILRRVRRHLRRQGWRETIIPFTGYGTDDHVRVLGRLVLKPAKPRSPLGAYAEAFLNQRGWRNFLIVPVSRTRVTVRVGDSELDLLTDRGGYIDVTVKAGMAPGWQSVEVFSQRADTTEAPVVIVDRNQDFGIISDIDDTILSTWLPRAFLAAWNSFILTEGNRQAVPGMARLYQLLLEAHPGAPIVYVSTGSWSTLPFLRRFMRRHGFPEGPMLLTNFGPTQTGWFRNGEIHKRHALGQLARDFPNIKWVLVGDDGQHDPSIYRDFSEVRPDRVRLIAIRQLSSAEQILAHGTITVLRDNANLMWQAPIATEVAGTDGDELAAEIGRLLDENEGD